MFVFGSIFGKNRLGKGLQGVAMFSLAAPRARRIPARPVAVSPMAARPETEHNISGAHPRTLSPQGCQSGRTLLEMLAVLAIIGILSVAALAGLMWAMAKYRANDTIHDVHLWQLAALDSNQLFDMTSGQLTLPELGSVSTHGYPMAVWIQDKDVFTVHVNDVPKRVCSLMLDMIDENQTVTVNDIRYDTTDICTNDTNALVFYMNKDMGNVSSICIPSCEEGETCCGGECRIIQTPCGTDGCTDCGSDYCTTSNTCCPTPTATKCGDTDCCDTKCCNGVCCPESYMTCDATTTCGCPNNMVPDADTGACKCPDEAPYFFEEAGICCKSGYTPVDGACQKISCSPSSGTGPYHCYINGVQCGDHCDSEGYCKRGICWANLCSQDSGPFMRIPNKGQYWGNYYGCQHASKPACYYVGNNQWGCWNNTDTGVCCDANADGQCTFGVCDETFCSAYSTDRYTATYSRRNLVGRPQASCWFTPMDSTQNEIQCYPHFRSDGSFKYWMCIDADTKNYCGIDCKDAPECDGNCSNYTCENVGYTVDENGYCCKELTGGEILCQKLYAWYVRQDNGTYDGCGSGCDATTGVCSIGACAASAVSCPAGTHVAFVGHNYGFGCVSDVVDEAGLSISCANAGGGKYICFYGKQTCGNACTSFGSGCNTVLMEQCGAEDPETGKKACPYNTTVTSTCYCDTAPSLAEGELCCAPNHVNVNGACAIL